MFGAIVLSEFNEIVHTFGDPTFRRFAAAPRPAPSSSASSADGTSGVSGVPRASVPSETSISRACSSASASSSLQNGVSSTTTSGVASTSADSPLRGAADRHLRRRKTAKLKTNADNNYLIDRNCLLDRVLPLVIIYRMSQEAQRGAGTNAIAATRRGRSGGGALTKTFDAPADYIEEAEADEPLASDNQTPRSALRFRLIIDSSQMRVRVTEYTRAFVVVFVADVESCSVTFELFQRTVLRCLDYHYGVAVQLLDAGYGSGALQERAERRVERLAAASLSQRRRLPNDAFNANLLYGNSESVSELSAVFRELTFRVAQTLRRKCRCIFVYCGQIVGAECSDPRAPALLDAYDTDAVMSLLEFALQDTAAAINSESLAEDVAADALARRCLKCQVEQAWLPSRQLAGRRQYVNVHVLSLTGELELICLSNAHFAPAVDAIADALSHLSGGVEPLLTARADDASSAANAAVFQRYQTDCAHAISAGAECFAKAYVTFDALKLPAAMTKKASVYGMQEPDVQKYVYLANLERTQKLIKNQWTRLCQQLAGFLQDVQERRAAADELGGRRPSTASFSYYYCSFPTSMRNSLARLGSSLSLVSVTSSAAAASGTANIIESDAGVYATVRSAGATSDGATSAASRRSGFTSGIASSLPSTRRTVGATHLNAMLTQLRRVLRGMLKELMECSCGLARNVQLHAVHAAVRQSVDKRLSTQLRTLLAGVVAAWRDGSPLRPLRLGLDALAYRVSRSDVPFNYHFVPNQYRSTFCRMSVAAMESDFVIARSENGDLLVQVTKADDSTLLSRKRLKFGGAAGRTTTCSAVFPACVNVTLALRQTYQLIAAFEVQINEAADRIK